MEDFDAPFLACNILSANETTFQDKYKNSTVVKFGEVQVGIIGYTSQDIMVCLIVLFSNKCIEYLFLNLFTHVHVLTSHVHG
jgi:2',3'-cyclic-nucleotide 2'-phosphodiesterase (5'-nucleotidase family)